jgi:hypothetical protein
MKSSFQEQWGSGEQGTVFGEHETRGHRKALPFLTMMASLVNPRKKKVPLGCPNRTKRRDERRSLKSWSRLRYPITANKKRLSVARLRSPLSIRLKWPPLLIPIRRTNMFKGLFYGSHSAQQEDNEDFDLQEDFLVAMGSEVRKFKACAG